MASSPIDIDALYAAAPQNFVAERKRLAKALKDAGRREEAKAIERLSRPTVSVWAVNQLARREAGAAHVKKLAALTAHLREAQGSGGGAVAELAAAHRAALAALRAAAEEMLIASGHKPSPPLLAQIVANLRAGVASAELRPRVEEGRLERDVEETGFAGLLDAVADGDARPPAPRAPRTAPPRAAGDEARRRQATQDRERERARAEALAGAEKRARQLETAVAAARKTLERAERAAAAAREALADAEAEREAARAEQARLARELEAAKAEMATLRARR
jgi:hypothetical protein